MLQPPETQSRLRAKSRQAASVPNYRKSDAVDYVDAASVQASALDIACAIFGVGGKEERVEFVAMGPQVALANPPRPGLQRHLKKKFQRRHPRPAKFCSA